MAVDVDESGGDSSFSPETGYTTTNGESAGIGGLSEVDSAGGRRSWRAQARRRRRVRRGLVAHCVVI